MLTLLLVVGIGWSQMTLKGAVGALTAAGIRKLRADAGHGHCLAKRDSSSKMSTIYKERSRTVSL